MLGVCYDVVLFACLLVCCILAVRFWGVLAGLTLGVVYLFCFDICGWLLFGGFVWC